jgi:hypothetical protein
VYWISMFSMAFVYMRSGRWKKKGSWRIHQLPSQNSKMCTSQTAPGKTLVDID